MNKEVIVVGNSAKLNERKQGKLIDEFFTVARINLLRLTPEITGMRITDWWRCAPYPVDTDLITLGRIEKMFVLQWRPNPYTAVSDQVKDFPDEKKIYVDKWLFELAAKGLIWSPSKRPKWARTGLLTICYYLELFDRVAITGFDFSGEYNPYYDGRPNSVLPGNPRGWMHDHEAECMKLEELIKEGRVYELTINNE